MLMPNKYIPIEDTLPGIGREIYGYLRFKEMPERLWSRISARSKSIGTVERFVYGLDFLYSLGLVDYKEGFLERTSHADQTGV